MVERILEFPDAVMDRRGRAYGAHVEAEQRPDGRWLAHVAFTPMEAGERLATGAETVQADVSDLHYWASGLTPAYLEGALARAQDAARLARRGEWREAGEVREARFRVECEEDRVPAELLGTFSLEPGVTRDLPDGSRIRYVATTYGGADGSHRLHEFVLEYREGRESAEQWLRERLSSAGTCVEFAL